MQGENGTTFNIGSPDSLHFPWDDEALQSPRALINEDEVGHIPRSPQIIPTAPTQAGEQQEQEEQPEANHKKRVSKLKLQVISYF